MMRDKRTASGVWRMLRASLVALGVGVINVVAASGDSPPAGEECGVGFGKFRLSPDDPTADSEQTAEWNCPEPYKVAWQTIVYLRGVYEAFIRMNGANPTSWEQLAAPPYMVVPLSELRNAYQNRSVQVIHQVSPCDDELSISPGDIIVGHYPDDPEYPEALFVAVGFIEPSPPWDRPYKTCRLVTPAINAEELATQEYVITVALDLEVPDEVVNFDDRVWMLSATAEEKYLAALAYIVQSAVDVSHHLLKRHPIDWQDFKDGFYWASSILNPYTGQPIQEVSTLDPSPGNCTYNPKDLIDPYYNTETGEYSLPSREQIIRDIEYMEWPWDVAMYCYNTVLEPVGRWKYDLEETRGQNLYATDAYENPNAVYDYLK